MRSNYPVSSAEMLTEINDIQESLISLIGYDSNPFDNVVEVTGILDTIDESLDSSILELLTDRLYKNISYGSIYKSVLTLNYIRRF